MIPATAGSSSTAASAGQSRNRPASGRPGQAAAGLPGSHLRRINEFAIARYQNFVGQEAMACPAGSLLVCHHGIWHCGQPNRTDRTRTMFKLRLNPHAPQRLLWDTADLHDPRVGKILSRDHGWYGHEVRLEIANRIRLWRELIGDPRYDVDFWLTRIENEPR